MASMLQSSPRAFAEKFPMTMSGELGAAMVPSIFMSANPLSCAPPIALKASASMWMACGSLFAAGAPWAIRQTWDKVKLSTKKHKEIRLLISYLRYPVRPFTDSEGCEGARYIGFQLTLRLSRKQNYSSP